MIINKSNAEKVPFSIKRSFKTTFVDYKGPFLRAKFDDGISAKFQRIRKHKIMPSQDISTILVLSEIPACYISHAGKGSEWKVSYLSLNLSMPN